MKRPAKKVGWGSHYMDVMSINKGNQFFPNLNLSYSSRKLFEFGSQSCAYWSGVELHMSIIYFFLMTGGAVGTCFLLILPTV